MIHIKGELPPQQVVMEFRDTINKATRFTFHGEVVVRNCCEASSTVYTNLYYRGPYICVITLDPRGLVE